MSALPRKADIDPRRRNVCFGPQADIMHRSKKVVIQSPRPRAQELAAAR
jgi:hypothetical protein